ncbi:MAG TPA: alginate export family protein [Rickettsiales bacterium]|nr:alginate export family protein [Rickettsiales bacterium]
MKFACYSLVLALSAGCAFSAATASADNSPTAPTPGAPKHYTLTDFAGSTAPEPGSMAAAIMNGTPWLEARYRLEDDSQDRIHRHAVASTLRTRIGYQTADFNHFKAGFEMQNVHDIGAEHFNNGINGKTAYPTVTDPEQTSLRQGYLDYDGAALYKTEIKAGRQIINLDNQRWIGQSDWRDLGNNFDGVSLYNTFFKNADLFYAYIRQANRGVGIHSPTGTLVGNTQLFHASYTVAPELKVAGYTYLIDAQSNNPAVNLFSTATYGVRLTGAHKTTDALTLSYALEGAKQRNYDNNPNHENNNYYLVEPGASAYGFTTTLGYAMMEGDGITSIQSPLNTNHSVNGWADKFTTVPLNGLLHRYATLTYKLPCGSEWIKGTELTGAYRKFDSDKGSLNYGHEWDGLISKTFFEHYSANLEVADYRASNIAYTNTYKFYAFFGVKF